MVLRAPDWEKRFHHELPNILRSDNHEYDTYQVFDRFPHHMPPPLGEPRTNVGWWLLLALGMAGIGIAAFERRRQLLAYTTAVLLLSGLVDLWSSYVGDPMEVNRHLVGPLLRCDVVLLLGIALGADSLIARLRQRPDEPEAPTPPETAPEEVEASA